MKKIGIVTEVEFYGKGSEKKYYDYPEIDSYSYIKHLVISIMDENNISLKLVIPKYNRNDYYFLGDLVEYDVETNRISKIDIYRKITDEEKNQINTIYQRYKEIIKGIPNIDLFIKHISDCSNIQEVKNALKSIKLYDQTKNRVEIEIILDSIKRQMTMRNLLNPNNINGLKK